MTGVWKIIIQIYIGNYKALKCPAADCASPGFTVNSIQ